MSKFYNLIRDFPRSDFELNIGPFPIQKWANNSQTGVYNSQFLCCTFWRKLSWKSEQKYHSYRCMKFCIKMWMKTCFVHIFMQIFMSFYDGKLKQQICYSFTLLSLYMFLSQLKWRSGCFRLHQVFPILMVQAFFPKFNRPLAPTSER